MVRDLRPPKDAAVTSGTGGQTTGHLLAVRLAQGNPRRACPRCSRSEAPGIAWGSSVGPEDGTKGPFTGINPAASWVLSPAELGGHDEAKS